VCAREEKAFNMCSIRARRALRIYPELTYVLQAFSNWPKNSHNWGAFKRSKTKTKRRRVWRSLAQR
jgi:hypothetical protein